MKIRHCISLLAIMLVVLPPLSCEKFLEQTDTSNVGEDALFKKPEDAVQLVNAIYNTFDPFGNYDIMKFSFYYINKYLTLDQINYGGDRNWATFGFDANHQAFEGLWNRFYSGIASANSALPIIAKMRDENILDQN